MKLLWVYMMAFLILPIIGEISILMTEIHISAGEVSLALINKNIIFVSVLLIVSYFVQNYKTKVYQSNTQFKYNDANTKLNKSIILLIMISIFIFLVGGYKILLGLADRGEVRASLGIVGPLYTLFLSYIPVALFVYNSVIYIYLNEIDKKRIKKKLIILYLFAIVLGILSGYKSVAVTLVIPGFVVLLFYKQSIFKLFMVSIIAFFVLTLFTALVRDINIVDAYAFMIYRITTMTAYGTIGVWNLFSTGASSTDIFMNLMGVFGEKISSAILGISSHEPEFLKTNLSRLVTYLVYPTTERALANSVNVTVTNFGHALYIMGRELYIYYAFIVGIIIGLIIRLYKIYIYKGFPLKTSLIALYFFKVIMSSINSGGIFMLFSLPPLVYLFLSYLILKYYIGGKLYVSKFN